jgi:hypothetical protein
VRGRRVALPLVAHRLRALLAMGATIPVGTFGPVPEAPCCASPGGRCPPGEGSYGPLWDTMAIRPELAEHYQYWVEHDGAEIRVRAVADLDCDAVPMTFELIGRPRELELEEVTIRRPERVE